MVEWCVTSLHAGEEYIRLQHTTLPLILQTSAYSVSFFDTFGVTNPCQAHAQKLAQESSCWFEVHVGHPS